MNEWISSDWMEIFQTIPEDNPTMAPLLDLFSKIPHKGDKINLDAGTLSLKSLLPRKCDRLTWKNSDRSRFCRGYAELLHLRWLINNADVLWKCPLDCFSRTNGSIKTSSKSLLPPLKVHRSIIFSSSSSRFSLINCANWNTTVLGITVMMATSERIFVLSCRWMVVLSIVHSIRWV